MPLTHSEKDRKSHKQMTFSLRECLIKYTSFECLKSLRSQLYLICIYYWPSARSRRLDIGWVLFVSVHKNAKRERGQYPAILTELAWSIIDLLCGIKSTEKNDLRTCSFSSTENHLDAKVMVRAPISWLDKCRKYNHLIGYISNSNFKFKFKF